MRAGIAAVALAVAAAFIMFMAWGALRPTANTNIPVIVGQ